MSKQAGFRKKSMAAAIAALTGLSGAALAQPESDQSSSDNLEEVVVLGIRGSLDKSMDIKRDAQGVVDAISAEDIGKFPDTNLAESMQRISGVSIDRVNGEGSKVTVRGLGPDFNLVTLNGRQLARTTGGRSFDFQNIASDMVTGVEVAKTSDATLPSGGMGATINLLTARPLETPEMTARFSVKGVRDESSDDASITPEYSGFYSDTFADGKFGVAISGSVQERESGSSQATVPGGWNSLEGQMDNNWDGVNDVWGAVPLVNQENRPGEGDIYSVSQNTAYKFEEQQRKRTNGQLVLQWAPTDDFTATVDYNYYENKIARQFNDISVYHAWGGDQRGVWTDGPISSPLIYTELYGEPSDVAIGGGSSAEVYEGDMAGINLDWQASDRLSLEFDAQHSEAERRPDSPWGTSNTLTLAALVRNGSSVDYTNDLPAIHVYTDDGIKASDIQVTGSVFENSKDQSEVDQFRFGGNFELNESSDIDFGISRQEVSNTSQSVYVQRNNWAGPGTPEDLPDDLFEADTIDDKFDMSWGDFSEIGGLDPLNTYFIWDFEAVRAAAENLYGDDPGDLGFVHAGRMGDCGTAFCASTDWGSETDRTTVETSNAAYLQYNLRSEMGGMPYQLNAGLRYEETEVESESIVPAFDSAMWASNNEVSVGGSGERTYLSETGEYSYLLPSLAFKLDLTEDLVARAAVSEAITRPGYNDIKGGTSIGTTAAGGIGGGSAGNPGLKPFESLNYDLSMEWYYGETSYASAGLFRKEVSNFISSGITEKTVFNIPNPADGALVDEARANGHTDSGAIRKYIAENHEDSPYVEVVRNQAGEIEDIFIEGNPETDRDMVFRVSQPVNGDVENTIDGLELAVQHFFGESGFGMQANYTFVDSDLEYDPFLLMDQESMVGLSDSANLVGFYDKNGFQARIAYNWRDEFLSARGQSTGANPQYTEAYNQIDVNVSYEVPQLEGMQVFLEGINVTDEYIRVHGRDDRQLLGLYQGGARWQLGARYAF